MVFSSTVLPGEEQNLTFAWPAALVDDGKGIPILNTAWKPNGYFALPILGKAGRLRGWVLCGFTSIF